MVPPTFHSIISYWLGFLSVVTLGLPLPASGHLCHVAIRRYSTKNTIMAIDLGTVQTAHFLLCPEICTMTMTPMQFYYRLAPFSIYKQCTSYLQALCSNRYHGYRRILNNAHQM